MDHGYDDIATATSHQSPQSSPKSRSSPIQPVGVSQSTYCTQQCLQSLLKPGVLEDRECPNYLEHARNARSKPTTASQLHEQLRAQLAVKARDLPSDYDWGYCHLPSAVGNAPMLKMMLGVSGHVFVAKAFAPSALRKMRRETGFYDRLYRLQGKQVPVCLGMLELQGDELLKHETWTGEEEEVVVAGLLLLGWTGYGVDSWPRVLGLGRRDEADHAFVRDLTVEARSALAEIHKAGVWHRDVALRNVLVRSLGRTADGGDGGDSGSGTVRWRLQVVFVDFELSWTRTKYRQYRRHRLRGTSEEEKTDEELDQEFGRELVVEMDGCAKEMEVWCCDTGLGCPHPYHGG